MHYEVLIIPITVTYFSTLVIIKVCVHCIQLLQKHVLHTQS